MYHRGMGSWSTPLLWAAFLVGAAATWAAGVYLTHATDALDVRWRLGETLGGMLLLSISGTLPEAAITVTAALSHRLDVATGNLLGGIAVQTAVLTICDLFTDDDKPLSYLVGSLIPVLEAILVVAVTSLALLGTLLPASLRAFGVSPASIAIVAVWLAGITVLQRIRNAPRWRISMPGSAPGRFHRRLAHPKRPHPYADAPTGSVVAVFAASSIVTLVAGVVLTTAGTLVADHAGINGVVFGATVLALASSLPEISTGVESVRIGDNQLAMADIFGGNSFQLTLFLVADLFAGAPTLPHAGAAESWLAGLGILVTTVYAASVIIRPERTYARLGLDSVIVMIALCVGTFGLAATAR
ncbi:MAG: hypothetical protein QMD76_00900 [Anaerosomatales bacterium]|nr:hypothetical protein [Anaerosomatales bacterium]